MAVHDLLTPDEAAHHLNQGAVIAYPTEAVFGLGCDPRNEAAVRRVLSLKGRPESAGLILIADCFERFEPYIEPVSQNLLDDAMDAWPGPVTWLFPRADSVPDWLAGVHPTIALRLTAHPVCRAICSAFGGPIVSTSANPSTAPPALSAEQVETYFGDDIGGIVDGELGSDGRPSEIRDLATGKVLRKG